MSVNKLKQNLSLVKRVFWLLAATSLLLFGACERKTEVIIEGENPPIFVLSGSGTLGEVIITKPVDEQTNNSSDEESIIWRITARRMPGEQVESLHSLTYGTVPAGYTQAVPMGGPAPKLQTGKRYGYLFVTADAPHAAGYFEMRDGKVVEVRP